MSMNPGKAVMFGLIGACGLVGGVIALVQSGIGQGIDSLDPEAKQVPVVAGTVAEVSEMLPEDYVVITDRPLFDDTRRPVERIETGVEEDVCPDGVSTPPECGQPPVVELDVTVKGIVITPSMKVAMITDNQTQETMRIKEGMPLEGNLGAWSVASIEPRRLTFSSEDGSDADMELEVHKKAMAPGKAPPPRTPVNLSRNAQAQNQPVQAASEPANSSLVQVTESTQQADPEDDAEAAARAARAEEIRRRVAERRAQLRQEAANRRQSQDDDNQ